MKRLILAFMLCWIAAQVHAAEWMTDLPKALAKAKADKKMVLMDFTGSDWCPGCIELHKKVLATPEFEKYADKNLVLVVVDFPQKKEQTEELKKANQALLGKYNVDGFPTVIVLDKDGAQVSKMDGYEGDSPQDFIAKLDKLKQKSS
ncbi:MAG TPA: thioredoxin family protein [Verrucomicrobiae bacterium]|nr:thioredoxin family protein [Verrucomicrobiae bacterium]